MYRHADLSAIGGVHLVCLHAVVAAFGGGELLLSDDHAALCAGLSGVDRAVDDSFHSAGSGVRAYTGALRLPPTAHRTGSDLLGVLSAVFADMGTAVFCSRYAVDGFAVDYRCSLLRTLHNIGLRAAQPPVCCADDRLHWVENLLFFADFVDNFVELTRSPLHFEQNCAILR